MMMSKFTFGYFSEEVSDRPIQHNNMCTNIKDIHNTDSCLESLCYDRKQRNNAPEFKGLLTLVV